MRPVVPRQRFARSGFDARRRYPQEAAARGLQAEAVDAFAALRLLADPETALLGELGLSQRPHVGEQTHRGDGGNARDSWACARVYNRHLWTWLKRFPRCPGITRSISVMAS